MSAKLRVEPPIAQLESESSSLSSALTDLEELKELDFKTTTTVTTQETAANSVRGTKVKSKTASGAALVNRGRKRAAEEETTTVKRAKRVAKETLRKYTEVEEDDKEEEKVNVSRKTPSKRKERAKASGVVKTEVLELKEEEVEVESSPKGTRRQKTKVKATLKTEDILEGELEETPKKPKRKRKTKEEKEAEAMPLAARTQGLKMFLGAHVSAAKGVQNAVTNCVHIGGNAFALFLKSQKKWQNPDLQPEHRDQFRAFVKEHKYDALKYGSPNLRQIVPGAREKPLGGAAPSPHSLTLLRHVLPHGSYLVNLAQSDATRATQAYYCFLDDLQRCESLGIRLYNFHPGWTLGQPRPEAIARIAKALNCAHRATSSVKTLLENMAGANNVIGSTFEDLRDIIALVEDKSRVGVCLDTCHAFAAGYDLRAPSAFKATMKHFSEIIGLSYLSAIHLNDSKAPLGAHRDLHQNIGLGFLGLSAFRNVMNESAFEGLPMVLETPLGDRGTVVWSEEIKLLEGLIGVAPDDPAFLAKEKELAELGAEERQKHQEAFERKAEKLRKVAEKGTKKKGKGKAESEASEGDSLSELESESEGCSH